jgi:hypothetical protein
VSTSCPHHFGIGVSRQCIGVSGFGQEETQNFLGVSQSGNKEPWPVKCLEKGQKQSFESEGREFESLRARQFSCSTFFPQIGVDPAVLMLVVMAAGSHGCW